MRLPQIFNKNFKFTVAQSRSSAGWDTTPTFASSWFGRIGLSSYTTKINGRKGLFYAFSSSKADVGTIFSGGTEYYAGIGINLWNIIGVEVEAKVLGLGSNVNLFSFSIGVDLNLLGITSVTFGYTQDIEDGYSRTYGFTLGLNKGFVVLVIVRAYEYAQSGGTSSWQRVWQLVTG